MPEHKKITYVTKAAEHMLERVTPKTFEMALEPPMQALRCFEIASLLLKKEEDNPESFEFAVLFEDDQASLTKEMHDKLAVILTPLTLVLIRLGAYAVELRHEWHPPKDGQEGKSVTHCEFFGTEKEEDQSSSIPRR